MDRRVLVLALLPLAARAQTSGAPFYSAAGLVNAATGLPGPLAPNSWATLYGSNLAWVTATAEIVSDQLPIRIVGAGVQVLFSGSTPAHLLFVSPKQINFLVPASRMPGNTTLTVVRDGVAGPGIPVTISEVSPALFQSDSLAVATHPDGSVINPEAPAGSGEIVVLYASGLGQTVVPLDSQNDGRLVPLSADPALIRIRRLPELRVTLNDTQVDPACIYWAGLTPGFAGLYQINLRLPETIEPNPQIRIAISDEMSPPGVKLATR